MSTTDNRPTANGVDKAGIKKYSLMGVEDTSERFIVSATLEVNNKLKNMSFTFPVRPPLREQMEYAHACMRSYLDNDNQIPVDAPEKVKI